MSQTERAIGSIPEDAWEMIEAAGRLLESDGYIVRPGVYTRWMVAPILQGMGGGYMAFLRR